MSDLPAEAAELLCAALEGRAASERSRMVREVADLFLAQASSYSSQQVQFFDDVMLKMIDHVDEEIRIFLSRSLAPIDNAPKGTVRYLANDSAIAVARPVLVQSTCLDDDFLVESSRTRSQEHLAAISARKVVARRVADVLVERGDDRVLLTLAGNEGAELSEKGYSAIIARASGSAQLARVVWNRPDIPRPQLMALFEKASSAVRRELEAEGGRKADEIISALQLASQKLQEQSQQVSSRYEAAKARVKSLQQTGGLSESHILSFATEGEFEAAVVAIAELSRLSIGEIERIALDHGHDRLFIVSRAIGLSWASVRQILLMNRTRSTAAAELDQLRAQYQSIPRESAAKSLQFHQLREKARTGAARAS